MFQFVVFVCLIHAVHTNASDECSYVDYLGKQFDINKVGCPENSICNSSRVINVTYINFPLYFYDTMKDDENKSNDDLQKPVHQLLRRCCGTCANINQLKIISNMEELTPSTIKKSDFIYPIFSTSSKEKMYGYFYVPLIDIPGLMYATEPPKVNISDLFIQGRHGT